MMASNSNIPDAVGRMASDSRWPVAQAENPDVRVDPNAMRLLRRSLSAIWVSETTGIISGGISTSQGLGVDCH